MSEAHADSRRPAELPQDEAHPEVPSPAGPTPIHAEEQREPSAATIIPRTSRSRRTWRRVLMAGGVIAVLGATSIGYMNGGRYVGTDDAYVKAAQLNVTTDVSGMVKSVEVVEGQHVEAGDVLFRLDPEPFQIALDNAKATLLQAETTVRALKADYRKATEQVSAQKALVDVTKTTLDRIQSLVKKGSAAQTQLDQQRASYLSAVATLSSLEQASAATLARLNGDPDLPVEKFPDVMKARAAVAEAQRQLDHTVVRAPFAGTVARVSSLQPGTLIVSAMSAFSSTSAVGLVSATDQWVEANMKETDLTRVHRGQPVEVTIDTYPDCRWRGSVESVSVASGAAFSPLPAENISGNWVKVVQRIPVRVSLDNSSCDVRLSAGMSAVVSIDTGYSRWHALGL